MKWLDALNGTARPVLAYAFFLLCFVIKCMQFSMVDLTDPLPWQLEMLWPAEDQAIFAGIISLYFGQRTISKVRQGRQAAVVAGAESAVSGLTSSAPASSMSASAFLARTLGRAATHSSRCRPACS